jgi:uncharacterized protein
LINEKNHENRPPGHKLTESYDKIKIRVHYQLIPQNEWRNGEIILLAIIGAQLAISWIMLYFFTKKNLLALGIIPTKRRLIQFVIGFIFYSVLSASIQLLDSAMTQTQWKVNPELTFTIVLDLFWWDTKSVVFEELLFRGALLYIAIQIWGAKKGMILSAITFGFYHWITYGVLGDFAYMAFVLIMTAIPGLLLAYSFVKTNSIALPIGLHLGWNFTNNSIFSNGSWHDQSILVPLTITNNIQQVAGLPLNYLVNVLLSNLFVPLLTYIILRHYSTKIRTRDDLHSSTTII